MINFLVIGLCIILMVAVIYISAKPISMGIESRRNIKYKNSNRDNLDNISNDIEEDNLIEGDNITISEEIIKLKKLKDDGVLSHDEFEKAKEKLLN